MFSFISCGLLKKSWSSVYFLGLWHHIVWCIITNILEEPAASIFKGKLVNMYQTTWCQNPKDHNHENLRYDIMGSL
jgi:hypothetical protein